MKYIVSEQVLDVPEGVKVDIAAREITVTGPRGVLKKSLKHIPVTFHKESDTQVRVSIYNGSRKQIAAVRTVRSLIENMITGVTKGYKYKMRYVWAHFPISVNIEGQRVEIRNYLGEKSVRVVQAHDGVKVEISKDQKDELILTGNSVEDVSLTAASIQQSCKAPNKDIRKFLDGIYVSSKGFIQEDEGK